MQAAFYRHRAFFEGIHKSSRIGEVSIVLWIPIFSEVDYNENKIKQERKV